MKKEMFEKWYASYGRELAVKALPLDEKELEEKEIRKYAKNIYSSVYNSIKEKINSKLELIQYDIFEHIKEVNKVLENALSYKEYIINEIANITEITTTLYDKYLEHKVDEDIFKKTKEDYGTRLFKLKGCLKNTDVFIKITKDEKKELESLIVSR